jgi:prepilin-type N-terminal cleavage/methylation domain-containing protein
MMTAVKARRDSEGGFTLIEVLITVVILGIVSSIAVIAVGATVRNAQIKSCIADWNSIYVAANAWQSDQTIGNITPTSYPTITDLVTQGYLVKPDNAEAKYTIGLSWPQPADATAQPVATLTVSQNGQNLIAPTGDTSRGADCKAVTN